MESSDPMTLHSEDVQRGSPPISSNRRLHTAQRLVNRMPSNPKIAVFESTQERFEVPLRSELWSAYAVGGCPGSSLQQQIEPNFRQKCYVPDDPTGDFIHNGHAPRRKNSVRHTKNVSDDHAGVGVRRRKKSRSSHCHSKEKDSAPDNSRLLTDYFLAQDGTKVPPRPNRCAKTSRILNIRCNPSDVIFTVQLLNPDQYAAVEALGFGHLLRMDIDSVECRELLAWLMDRVSPVDMIIRVGPGKLLPISPSTISMVLGLPIGGSSLCSSHLTEASQFRKQLISELNQESLTDDDPIHISNLQEEILKGRVNSLFLRCFFMIVFNRLLFPASSSNIESSDIIKAMHPELFSAIDFSHAVFNDLQSAIRRWHERNKKQLRHTIFGCGVFLIVLYLDNLQHTSSPTDWISTPRARFYDKATVHRLTIADRIRGRDGSETYGFLSFKSRSNTCYNAVDVRNVGLDDMTNVPMLHVPRMCDLLSHPLGCLNGRPLQAFHDFFDQFDQTLSENTCAIHASLRNIARAPYHLAEKCRPLIEELIITQRSSSDPNIIGETSRRNNSGKEEDTVDPHNVFEHGNCALGTPSTSYRDGVFRDGNVLSSSTPDPAQSRTRGTTPSSRFLDRNRDMQGLNNLIDAINCEENSNPRHTPHASGTAHPEDLPDTDPSSHSGDSPTTREPHTESHFTTDESTPEAYPSDTNMVSGTLCLAEQRTGKRMTRIPARFCSPFKYGIMSRPPPNVDASMSLLGHICADDSRLRSTPVIQFGSTRLTGDIIAQSFANGASPDPIFMTGFVKCVRYDDFWIRPECHGYRIILDADLSAILNVE